MLSTQGAAMRIRITADKLKLLRLENEISIKNPGQAAFGTGNARLEVTLASGRTARSSVSDRYFSAGMAGVAAAQRAAYGWQIVPVEVSQEINLGQSLGRGAHQFFEDAQVTSPRPLTTLT